ncbi:hypothetical protein WN51_09824 [Melipona quadrifasciata]|uniref:Uncharacterized protein n=1 Tax=Melipona quadrifasciata TaxID=166423 RepID=A0A0M9A588_9HYME|nr:hypothetical protein WN51_09824 [Melipona quadrifasciata]
MCEKYFVLALSTFHKHPPSVREIDYPITCLRRLKTILPERSLFRDQVRRGNQVFDRSVIVPIHDDLSSYHLITLRSCVETHEVRRSEFFKCT